MTLLVPTDQPPITLGEMLVEEFLKPLGVSPKAFAEYIGITYARLNEIVNGQRRVTPDTAMRFSRALGTTPDLWLNMQMVADLYEIRHGQKAADIDRIRPIVPRP
jgi:addiction module HigA family antidote